MAEWTVSLDSRVDMEHRLVAVELLGSACFVYSFSLPRRTTALRFEERHDKSIINQIYLLST